MWPRGYSRGHIFDANLRSLSNLNPYELAVPQEEELEDLYVVFSKQY